jgi:hypothetical protein
MASLRCAPDAVPDGSVASLEDTERVLLVDVSRCQSLIFIVHHRLFTS